MSDIKNKVIVITGASSGIGEATAKLLAKKGAIVVLAARRVPQLKSLVEEIRFEGGTADYMAVDVTKREEMKALIQFTLDTYGRVDGLVNNAGIMPLSPLNELKVDEWDQMIDVNIRGVLNGIAAALPVMQAQGKGQFVNVASIGAHSVSPTAAVYCATKYAVWAISEGLRQESKNIRVTTISPGVTETELGHDISDDTAKDFLKELRKISLSSEAVAKAIFFAVSQPDDVDINEIIVRPTASAF